ncbi:hypothetical protein TSUD_363660 [Trifolium subterraneum]|uniref:Uncharacterized protein n=1 Tax=Trifolium subterraneum TaxID=3900 RepID=A0A2Z6MXQ9_TRISU|nr:hypothetical protein TSUD_363660 [Trifolium subterraneum]
MYQVFNFSTGRIINKSLFDAEVTAMDHDHTGHLIFCGDAQYAGMYILCKYELPHRMEICLSSGSKPISHYSHVHSVILIERLFFLGALNLAYYSVALEIKGYLTLRCSLKLTPRIHKIQASFCPLLSLEKGEFIVAGSEDSNVYFYDLTKPKHTCVNKLQGHRFPVMGIAWNHGENFLASSDFYGIVIVWKRERTNQNNNT